MNFALIWLSNCGLIGVVVSTLIVSVVWPILTNATLTGILAGLLAVTLGLVGVAVAVGVAAGVPVAEAVGVAVAVAVGVAVAVAVTDGVTRGETALVAVGVGVVAALVGSVVSGSFFSTVSISLTVGVTFAGNLVIVINVIFVVFPLLVTARGEVKMTESPLPYLFCKSFWITPST